MLCDANFFFRARARVLLPDWLTPQIPMIACLEFKMLELLSKSSNPAELVQPKSETGFQ